MAQVETCRQQAGPEVYGDDRALAARIAVGDQAAFAHLVRVYHPVAYELACRLLTDCNDAEEVTQDAFVKIYHAAGSFRGQASLKTWVLRIVMRLSLNRRRDHSRSAWARLGLQRSSGTRSAHPPPEPATPPASTPEGLYLAGETRARIMALIEQLPENLRQVLLLNSLDQLSYEEIGRILGIPVGTVSSRLHAARRRLRQALARLDLI